MCSLHDKVSVIVGASQGIGAATAELFAEAGSTVVLAARNADGLEKVSSRLAAAGYEWLAVPTDIKDIGQVERLIDTVRSRLGRIDVLVNCAGGTEPADWSPLIDLTGEQWDHVVELNFRAAFFLAQRAALVMKGHGGGVIINLSSRSASIPNPGNGHFCASKAGLESLTRSMGLEWAQYGIRVNAIAPGLVATQTAQFLTPSDDDRRLAENRTPIGRLGTPEDVAALTLFLASDRAGWMTGTTIAINGGSPVPNGYLEFLDELARRRSG